MNDNPISRKTILVCVSKGNKSFYDDTTSYLHTILPKGYNIVEPWDAGIAFDKKIEEDEYKEYIKDTGIEANEIETNVIAGAFAKAIRNRAVVRDHLKDLIDKGLFLGMVISSDDPDTLDRETVTWAHEMHSALRGVFVVSFCKNFDPSKYPYLKGDIFTTYLPWEFTRAWGKETNEKLEKFLNLWPKKK